MSKFDFHSIKVVMPQKKCILFKLLPESARFHVASGQQDKAMKTLQEVAKQNGKPMLSGRLVVEETSSADRRGRIKDLLGADLRKTSLLLWFIW